jgi:Phage protein Gp138 N-terminal domain
MSSQGFISIPQRLKGTDVEMYNELIRQALCDARVALPGIVQSFDAVTQTVVVQVAILEKILNARTHVPEAQAIPLIQDIPIVLPRSGNSLAGGGVVLTMPIVTGDEVLVIFADMDFDNWFQSGAANGPVPQMFKRRHDITDAFAVLAPWSQPRKLANYSTSSMELRTVDGTIKISLNATGIIITSPEITMTGNLVVDGSITSTSNMFSNGTSSSFDGKPYLAHTHTGVTTGGSDSGPIA